MVSDPALGARCTGLAYLGVCKSGRRHAVERSSGGHSSSAWLAIQPGHGTRGPGPLPYAITGSAQALQARDSRSRRVPGMWRWARQRESRIVQFDCSSFSRVTVAAPRVPISTSY